MDNFKMNVEKCHQGLDGIQMQVTLGISGTDTLYIDEEPLVNEDGKEIGKISCHKGKVEVYFNPCYCIRNDNVKPFGVLDSIKIDSIRTMVLASIGAYLKKHLRNAYTEATLDEIMVMQAECNITRRVECAEISDVIDFFEKAFSETILHRERVDKNDKKNFEKKSTAVSCVFPKRFFCKIYNKTAQQLSEKNPLVEPNLLRIEIKFFSASMRKFFNNNNTLNEVLSKEGLIILCREYKRAFEEIEDKYLKPYLSYCKNTLYTSLCNAKKGSEVSETVSKYKHLISDVEILRKSLKAYFAEIGVEDRSHKIIYYYTKGNFGIPVGVLKTIKMFHQSMG